MRINFRQGLIAFQKDSGTPVFLQQSSAHPGFVQHVVSPTTTMVAFAHGTTDYLMSFDTTTDPAWGPFTGGVDNHMYWDIDLLTGHVSRGITLLIPINAVAAPSSPANDQHWFDLTNFKMMVWSQAANKWREKVRVFAGRAVLGNANNLVMFSEGSQVGLSNTPSNPGYIVLDTLLQPLRKSVGEFLTDDDPARVRTTVGTGGVLVQPVNRVIPIKAGEAIPRMSLVYFSGPDTIRLASSNPGLVPQRIPVGVSVDALANGDVGTFVSSGELTYDQWDWSGHEGEPLYCDDAGAFTLYRPAGLMAFRVGFIKNAQTVLFNVDAETYPQVYQASVNSLIISGQTPVQTTDVINGLGERVVTVIVPNATALAAGLMTAAEFTQLGQHETRITAAEGNITSLQLTKADVGHTHIIADVTGLQAALTAITNSIVLKADKVVPATNGHFAGLNGSGNLTDSTYKPSDFALASHLHTIPDVTGLQTALDQKSYRNHLNAISEIFTGVDRTGALDVGTGASLTTVLAGKSDVGHIHAIADVSGLQSALNNKIDIGTNFPISQIIGLQGELDNRAFVSHTHIIANVTGLQTALDGKEPLITAGTTAQYWRGDKTWQTLNKNAVGLSNVDNTSDLNKPISIATQAALDGKADVTHFHVIADVTGLQAALDGKVAKAGDTMTGDLINVNNTFIGRDFSTINSSTGLDGYVQINRVAAGPDVSGQILFYGADNSPRAAIGRADASGQLRFASLDNAFDGSVSVGSSAGPGGGVGLFTPTTRLMADGKIVLDGTAGDPGQVITSQGTGGPAVWVDASGSFTFDIYNGGTSEGSQRFTVPTDTDTITFLNLEVDQTAKTISVVPLHIKTVYDGADVQVFPNENASVVNHPMQLVFGAGLTATVTGTWNESLLVTSSVAAPAGLDQILLNNGSGGIIAAKATIQDFSPNVIVTFGDTSSPNAIILPAIGAGPDGGSMTLQSHNASLSGNGNGGDTVIDTGIGNGTGAAGNLYLRTGGTTRLQITPTGAWQVDGASGALGQVLTSQGDNTPEWQDLPAPAAAVTYTFEKDATGGETNVDCSPLLVASRTVDSPDPSIGIAHISVYLNGVLQREGATRSYTVAAPRTIIFNTALEAGDELIVYSDAWQPLA